MTDEYKGLSEDKVISLLNKFYSTFFGIYQNENFLNKNIYARAISMSIEKDENIDGHALLLLSALHPSMNIDASSMLVCGKRDDILSFMNKENFTKKVEEEIIKLSDSLKRI